MTPRQIELNNARQARYRLTEKCKVTKAKYRASPKGIATDKKHDLKHRHTPERKEYLKKYDQSPKRKEIRAMYNKRPETQESKYIKSLQRFYKMTHEEFNALKEKQQNKCAICGVEPKQRLCVDHCHSTGRVRGLLCRKCNLGIGYLQDSVDFLSNAINYLK